MKKLLIVMVILLTGCANTAPQSLSKGSIAPCSEIKTTAMQGEGLMLECLDGEGEVAVQSIQGPAVISVWASWCKNCEAQRPYFTKLYEEAGGRIQVIGVDVEEGSKQTGLNHAINKGMSFPQLFDPDGRTSNYFGPGVPITQFIAKDGSIAFQKIGAVFTYEELKQLVAEHLDVKI